MIPALYGVGGPLSPALVHLHAVELDDALLNVHGLCTRDIGLEGQRQEWDVIDEQEELVSLHDVAELKLPVQNTVLQLEREQSRVAQFFPNKNAQKYNELEDAVCVESEETTKGEEKRVEKIFTLAQPALPCQI